MQLEEVLLRKNLDRFEAKLDAMDVLTALHGLFYAAKAFLDVYAQLLCVLIAPGQTISFRRRRVGGTSIAGGAFIHWLRQSCPASYKFSLSLADLLENESREWITELVAHRDQLGHYSDIEDIQNFNVPLCKINMPGQAMYDGEAIDAPRMPSGEYLEKYATGVGERLRSLVRQTLPLAPGVNLQLIHYPDFSLEEED